MTEPAERKISETGQLRLPRSFQLEEKYLALEPGVYSPPDNLELYPVDSPPAFYGYLAGEIMKVPVTERGQITIPIRFREGGFEETNVVLIFQEDGKLILTPSEFDNADGEDVDVVDSSLDSG